MRAAYQDAVDLPSVGRCGRHSVVDLPAAGSFRARAYGPRELLSRTGSHAFSPAHHPLAEHYFNSLTEDPNPRGEHTMMRLGRSPSAPQFTATRALTTDPVMRSAGIGTMGQTAKTRGEFKTNQVHGQFSNDEVNGMPICKKMFQPLRSDTSIGHPHQKATSGLRRELERAGHLPMPRLGVR
mmetsp:Transcript_103050/g.162877  ORF Transcript_103050/g.162877 Transcript_103050/m.162877 type:complete len:182 (-) Transcript_103050:151-696(-)